MSRHLLSGFRGRRALSRCAATLMAAAGLVAAPAASADSPAGWSVGRPLEVYDRAALTATGHTDLGQALAALSSAFRFASPFAVNGDEHVRTGTLRGLAPDHVVVLVNGVRQHTSAKLHTADQAGRGSVGVDLALLPLAAVARVEVLAGGAGGRFGSGAQAGVINIVLDDADHGGRLDASFGQRRSAIEGVPRFQGAVVNDAAGTIDLALSGNLTEDDGDGDDLSLQGSWGFGLGNGGFMRLSAEYQNRDRANRAGYDPRPQYPLQPGGAFDVRERTVDRRRSRYGDPALEELNILFNAALPVADRVTLYGFTFLGTRNAISYAPFVRPVDEVNVIDLHPEGFLPAIHSDIDDRSFTLGARGERWGWQWDASYSQREDEIDLSVRDTLNPTFGAVSPTRFVTGNNEMQRSGLQLDVQRTWLPAWWGGAVTVEAGAAMFSEEYEIETGDLAAAFDAGLAVPGPTRLPAASVGFPGFPLESERTRDISSAYVSLAVEPAGWMDVSASLRVDDLDDIDTLTSLDLAADARLTDEFEVRAAAGRGFRAPSLAQVTYTRPVRYLTPDGAREAGIYAPDSAEVAALGAGLLEEESTTHVSLGAAYRPIDRLSLQIDLWQVEIDDRVVLSDALSGPVVTDALLAAGLSGVDGVQFALNGVDTRTRGVDARARYAMTLLDGELELHLGLSHHRTRASGVRTLVTAAGDGLQPFSDRAAAQLEREQPETKVIAGAAWRRGPVDAHARLTRFGEVVEYGDSDLERLDMGAVWLVDLDVRYQVNRHLTFGVGVHNLLNEYPDARPLDDGSPVTHSLYPFSGYAPFNASGRLMFARMSAVFD